MKFLKKTVILSLVSCLLFTVIVILLSYFGVILPDVLIDKFYLVFGIELGATMFIKIADAYIERQKIRDKISDMKDEGISPEREDFRSESNSIYSDYNEYEYGG